MIQLDQLILEIAQALEVEASSLTVETTSEQVETWDSLGQISILARLDDLLDNVTERLPKLAEASSVKEIADILGIIE